MKLSSALSLVFKTILRLSVVETVGMVWVLGGFDVSIFIEKGELLSVSVWIKGKFQNSCRFSLNVQRKSPTEKGIVSTTVGILSTSATPKE